MEIWEAAEEYKKLVEELRTKHHPHLAGASIWVLISDAKCIVDNRLVVADAKLCTKTEKMKTKHDFKITIRATGWHFLTEVQRKMAIDEALCRCGVKYIPQTITVNGKAEILKDEIGRIIFTEEIATDESGTPKWKMIQPDAQVYFQLMQRYGKYNEGLENIFRIDQGLPIKKPMAAQQGDIGDAVDEIDEPTEPESAEVELGQTEEVTPDGGTFNTGNPGLVEDPNNIDAE